MATNTISLKDVTLVVGGNNVTDLSPEGVKITFNQEIFTHVSGVNSSTRMRNSDESGMVEVNLLSTSVLNGVFNAIIDLDLETNNNRFGFSCVDNLSGESYSGINCFFKKRPDPSFDETTSTRVYTFVVPTLKMDKSVVAA